MPQMTPERWQRVTALLEEVLPADPSGRATLLDGLCGDDAELRREVESLLSYEDETVSVLQEPLVPWHPERRDSASEGPGEETSEIGLRIGPYRVLERLGTGGMGTVFLAAREDDFQKKVALKQIRRRMLSEEVLYRFENERQILADLDHPNIARILDGGQTEDLLPYFAMEYVEGQPIDRYCDERRLTLRRRIELVLEICSALQLAHQNLVVHRDLKPGNILVTPEGVPKLIDFGIAKHLEPESAPREVATEAGNQPMTVRYASPEQLWALPITTAADIYSLGVLLYQLLTGHDPYRFDTTMLELYRAICEHQPTKPSLAVKQTLEVRLSEERVCRRTPEIVSRARGTTPEKLRSALAGDLDGILLKALRKRPEARYRSVEQLADDLRRYLDGRPVSACEGTFRYLAGKFVRRHARGLMAAGLVFLILLASGVAMTVLWQRAAEERAESAERTVRLLGSVIEVFDPDAADKQEGRLRSLQRLQGEISQILSENPELLADVLRGTLRGVYGRMGHDEEALSALEDALAILRELHPGDHPKIAEGLNNQGAILYRLGDYEGAGRRWRLALEMRQRLGFEEEELLTTMGNLATAQVHRGKLDEAARRYRQILEIQRRQFGERSLEAAQTLRNLGLVIFLRGDGEGARPLLLEALEIESGAAEPSPSNVAELRSTLGRVLHAQGRLEEAEEQLMEALEVRRRLFGTGHLGLARTRRNLAAMMIDAGEPATAEVLLAHAQPALRQARPADDWEIAELESLLGALMLEQGLLGEAKTCLLAGYRALAASRGSEVIYTRQALSRVVRFYESSGEPQRAAEYRALLTPGSR